MIRISFAGQTMIKYRVKDTYICIANNRMTIPVYLISMHPRPSQVQ